MEVTAGNVHDSVAWDAVYDEVTRKFNEVKFVTMDAGYKTPWIAKKTIEDGRVPALPYTVPMLYTLHMPLLELRQKFHTL